MPYTINNPPDRIKALPAHAKEIWIAAFNSALAEYKDETRANMVAWAAVKTKYEQDKDGNWKVKASENVKTYYPVDVKTLEFDENNVAKPIKVIPVGEWNHPEYGKMKISENDISLFVKNFNDGVRNDLPITEGHPNEGETKPAIGWFKQLINKGRDGLWAIIEWTEKGRQLIQEKAYKYFSPEFYTTYEDPETHKIRKNVLVGGALVNRPYFKELPAIVLSETNLINNNSNMIIEDVIAKTPEELSEEEKDFLKEHKEELSDEDKTKFASIIEEKTEIKEEPKTEEVETKVDGEVKTAEEKVKGEKNVLIDSQTLKILEEKAEKGVKAMEELHKQKIEKIVDSLTFSEHNSNATFLPKSKDKVVEFLLSLTDVQVEKFKEIVADLPKVKLFSELGGDSGLPIPDDKKLDELVKIKMSEDKGGKKLSYREALDQVLSEHPEIAEKLA